MITLTPQQTVIKDAESLLASLKVGDFANAMRNAKAVISSIEAIQTEELYANDPDEPFWNL